MPSDTIAHLPMLPELRLIPRQCRLRAYTPQVVPAFAIADQFIAYASPEATYAVTQRLLAGARRTILIGIYDFTAPYVRDLLVAAVQRGVQVSVMLDLDQRKGEPELWADLLAQGCVGVPAPSCASAEARYFPSCHEKVIVIDAAWTLVQSGNYSEASIPQNPTDGGDPAQFVPGNRDMGLAVHSAPLAAYFTQVLQSDMQLELAATGGRGLGEPLLAAASSTLAAVRPPQIPPTRFPSRRFRPRRPIPVQPVLSPDNYMQVIPDLLAAATHTIAIEQQYIRGAQPAIRTLLGAIRAARTQHPALQVRIVLARPYGAPDPADADLAALAECDLHFGPHVRYLNPAYFVHCHNKLLLVDGRRVLVSSQNWSDFAVTRNREAGLLVDYAPLAHYYQAIFDLDWATGLADLTAAPDAAPRGMAAVQDLAALVPLSLGDYVEV
ncbi:MAG: phospholipase D-like domain-containing protein [Chloroflexi bacterium]|nr:phospholipase D-like domain-containing protein [Chloroflexota bacterium]